MSSSEFKDYYQILGVKRQATEREIKLRYFGLAKELHPDANLNLDEASRNEKSERFKEIGEAYACLFDEDDRKRYDKIYDPRMEELAREPKISRETDAGEEPRPSKTRTGGKEEVRSRTGQGFEEFRNERAEDWWRKAQWDLNEYLEKLKQQEERQNAERQKEREREKEVRAAHEREWARAKSQKDSELKTRIFASEITLPENDRYLLEALVKIRIRPDLEGINVKDKAGNVLWEVERKTEGFETNYEVRRSVNDLVGPENQIEIYHMNGIYEEWLAIPGRTFSPNNLDHASGNRPELGLPRGLEKHISNLDRLAYYIDKGEYGAPGKYGTVSMGLDDEKFGEIKDALEEYVENNQGIDLGEIKTIRFEDVTTNIDESRLTEIPKMGEGYYRDR